MSKKYKIFMVGDCPDYASWFPLPYEITRDKNLANIFWWIGGADVAPYLYGEKEGSHLYVSYPDSQYEFAMWNFCKDKPVFKIGVCKGSQNLGAFNGSKMAQHSMHPFRHDVKTREGLTLNCISTHHNQVILDEKVTGLKEGIDYELIAWAEKLSPFHLNGDDIDYNFPQDYKEPEITWFGKSNSFLVQSHPEGMPIDSPFVRYCQSVLQEKILQSGI